MQGGELLVEEDIEESWMGGLFGFLQLSIGGRVCASVVQGLKGDIRSQIYWFI